MSIIPEIIIQKILVDGIRDIRNISWKSDQLFKSIPQNFAQEFYELLTKTPIDVTINYPREDSQFPCICILLRAEEETHVFLNDLMLSGYDSASGLMGMGEFFFSEGESSTADSYEPNGVIGDPRKLFDKDKNVYKEVKGSGQSCSYLLQIMTDNQNFTIFLYHLIRYIILSSIHTLEDNGIHELKLSGTDFLPQAAQQPNFVFMRGINMSFMYFADHFLVEGDSALERIAKAFVIDMGDSRKEGFSTLAEVQKLNVTSISPVTMGGGTSVAWTYFADGSVNTSGISVAGINFQTGVAVEFVKTNPAIPEDSPFEILGVDSYFTVTNKRFINAETVVAWDDGATGTEAATNLMFAGSGTVPSDLSEGMFLQVVGPSTHDAYREQRRIISFTSGVGGNITVANKFSGSLNGAVIKVVKESSTLLFDLVVSSDTPTGAWDVKFTNPDLISFTLTNSFTVT